MQLLDGLESVRFQYKRSNEEHLGFIAEDVPADVATKNHDAIKVLDVVSVLARCVKDQRQVIHDLSRRMAELEAAQI